MADSLTEREVEILQYAADGLTAEQISLQTGTARGTIHAILTVIRLKLEAENTTHAVATALRRMLID